MNFFGGGGDEPEPPVPPEPPVNPDTPDPEPIHKMKLYMYPMWGYRKY